MPPNSVLNMYNILHSLYTHTEREKTLLFVFINAIQVDSPSRGQAGSVCLEHCHAANNFLSDQQENAQIMLPQCSNYIIAVCAGEVRAQCYSEFTNLLNKLD